MTFTELLPYLTGMWVGGFMIGFDFARRRYTKPSIQSQESRQRGESGDQ